MTEPGVVVSFDAEGLRLDTCEDAEQICQKLDGQNVEVLILQGNTFNIEAAERVGLELARHPNLKEAHFKDLFTSRGREIVPTAMSHLLKGIIHSGAQLTLLDLSDNAIGPIGAPTVIEFLESSAADKIEKLYLNNCGLGPEGSTSIAATISRLTELREFICGRNRLENKGATNMSRALSSLRSLELLRLNQNGIFVEGIKNLVGALKSNIETIREIDLSDNTIKAEGSEALAEVIQYAKNLETIRLDDALIQNRGFTIICDALYKSPCFPKLKLVSFEGNELSGNKIIDLIEITFADCNPEMTLSLLENEFKGAQISRLNVLAKRFDIYIDDPNDSDEDDSEQSQDAFNSDIYRDDLEEGEIDDDDDDSEGLNGYVDLSNMESDLREVSQDFIEAVDAKPLNHEKVNSAFIQLLSTGRTTNQQDNYQPVQILCEELGLLKMEESKKKKPLASQAIAYIVKRLNDLPPAFRDFFEVIVKNNKDITSGKILFDKL